MHFSLREDEECIILRNFNWKLRFGFCGKSISDTNDYTNKSHKTVILQIKNIEKGDFVFEEVTVILALLELFYVSEQSDDFMFV